jgi:conjugal transfer mating pair stabilization protein TraG
MTMLTALRSYQRVQSWHREEACGCQGPAPAGEWTPIAEINTVLPESGTGFRTYNRERDGVDQVGRPGFIDQLTSLGEEWAGRSEVPFQVGDISRRGGGPFPPHSGHQNGNEADLRPFRKDGAMLPVTYTDANYSQAMTRAWCQMVKEKHPDAVILFNDPALIREGLTRHYKGHHNHLHLRIPIEHSTEDVVC